MSNTPPGLQQVLLRCLEKAPEQRYASMAELARDLVPFSQDPHQAQVLVERMARTLRRSQVQPAEWNPSHSGVSGPVRKLASGERAAEALPRDAAAAGSGPTVAASTPPPARRSGSGAAIRLPATGRRSKPGALSATMAVVRPRRRATLLVVAAGAVAAVTGVGGAFWLTGPRTAPGAHVNLKDIAPSAPAAPAVAAPPALPRAIPATAGARRANLASAADAVEPAAAAGQGSTAATAADPAGADPIADPSGSLDHRGIERARPAERTRAPAAIGRATREPRSKPTAGSAKPDRQRPTDQGARRSSAASPVAPAEAPSDRCDPFADNHGNQCSEPGANPRK